MMEIGPESAPEPYQNVGIFTRLLEELKNCSSKHYVSVVFWDAFWPTFLFLGQKSPPGSDTFNPDRTPGCVFRCVSWKIASQNHKYSLGFNWYFERGDDGILELKKHEIWQQICRYFWPFDADVKKSARKGPINDSVEQLLSYPFPEISEITMRNDLKSIRGVAKTHVLHFRESSKIPIYLLSYFDDLETRFPEFHDFIQNVTFYALKGSVSWNLRKSAEFDPQTINIP